MPLPGAVTFSELSEYVKDHLAKAPTEILQPHWDSAINAGVTTGYWTVVNAWQVRGYTKAQVDQWDRLAEFQKDIGAWFALKRLSVLQTDIIGAQALDKLDRRPELVYPPLDGCVSAVLTIDGEVVEGEGTYGQSSFGPMDTTHDMFVPSFNVEDDGRVGTLTKF